MIAYPLFIAQFPEFSDRDPATVDQAIAAVLVETNGYEGLGSIPLQQQALMLHVAHNLTAAGWAMEGKPGPIKSVRSNNDSMEFAVNPYAGFGLESTSYGTRLTALLRRANTVFVVR